MKIVSLNRNVERYGFLSEMEYKNEDFHGHQTALCIGIKDGPNSWDKVYTSGNTTEEKIKIANEMLKDKSLIILEDKYMENANGQIVPKIAYLIPYYVENHSVYQPTVNYDQIPENSNVTNDIKIEVLFVNNEGFNRYVTFDFSVHGQYHLCLLNFVRSIDERILRKVNKDEDFVRNIGEHYRKGEISLDFYDKIGRKTVITAPISDFLKMISSIRIIDINTKEI